MQQFCVGRKKEKPKLCRRKRKHLPKTAFSGKTEKSAQLTSQCFQTLVECKASIARRKEEKTDIWWEGKKGSKSSAKQKRWFSWFLTCISAGPISSRASWSQAQPWLWCWHIWTGLLAKPAPLEPPRVSYIGSWSGYNCAIKAKKNTVSRRLWEIYMSLHTRMNMST